MRAARAGGARELRLVCAIHGEATFILEGSDSWSFTLSGDGGTRSIHRARTEAAKCLVLCANCNAEVDAGLASVF